jgi:hypothetical protein
MRPPRQRFLTQSLSKVMGPVSAVAAPETPGSTMWINARPESSSPANACSYRAPGSVSNMSWKSLLGDSRRPTLSAPMAADTAATTSNKNRQRFSTEPPYWSVR